MPCVSDSLTQLCQLLANLAGQRHLLQVIKLYILHVTYQKKLKKNDLYSYVAALSGYICFTQLGQLALYALHN